MDPTGVVPRRSFTIRTEGGIYRRISQEEMQSLVRLRIQQARALAERSRPRGELTYILGDPTSSSAATVQSNQQPNQNHGQTSWRDGHDDIGDDADAMERSRTPPRRVFASENRGPSSGGAEAGVRENTTVDQHAVRLPATESRYDETPIVQRRFSWSSVEEGGPNVDSIEEDSSYEEQGPKTPEETMHSFSFVKDIGHAHGPKLKTTKHETLNFVELDSSSEEEEQNSRGSSSAGEVENQGQASTTMETQTDHAFQMQLPPQVQHQPTRPLSPRLATTYTTRPLPESPVHKHKILVDKPRSRPTSPKHLVVPSPHQATSPTSSGNEITSHDKGNTLSPKSLSSSRRSSPLNKQQRNAQRLAKVESLLRMSLTRVRDRARHEVDQMLARQEGGAREKDDAEEAGTGIHAHRHAHEDPKATCNDAPLLVKESPMTHVTSTTTDGNPTPTPTDADMEKVVQETVRKAREAAQEEITELLKASVERARQSAEQEILQLVQTSMARVKSHQQQAAQSSVTATNKKNSTDCDTAATAAALASTKVISNPVSPAQYNAPLLGASTSAKIISNPISTSLGTTPAAPATTTAKATANPLSSSPYKAPTEMATPAIKNVSNPISPSFRIAPVVSSLLLTPFGEAKGAKPKNQCKDTLGPLSPFSVPVRQNQIFSFPRQDEKCESNPVVWEDDTTEAGALVAESDDGSLSSHEKSALDIQGTGRSTFLEACSMPATEAMSNSEVDRHSFKVQDQHKHLNKEQSNNDHNGSSQSPIILCVSDESHDQSNREWSPSRLRSPSPGGDPPPQSKRSWTPHHDRPQTQYQPVPGAMQDSRNPGNQTKPERFFPESSIFYDELSQWPFSDSLNDTAIRKDTFATTNLDRPVQGIDDASRGAANKLPWSHAFSKIEKGHTRIIDGFPVVDQPDETIRGTEWPAGWPEVEQPTVATGSFVVWEEQPAAVQNDIQCKPTPPDASLEISSDYVLDPRLGNSIYSSDDKSFAQKEVLIDVSTAETSMTSDDDARGCTIDATQNESIDDAESKSLSPETYYTDETNEVKLEETGSIAHLVNSDSPQQEQEEITVDGLALNISSESELPFDELAPRNDRHYNENDIPMDGTKGSNECDNQVSALESDAQMELNGEETVTLRSSHHGDLDGEPRRDMSNPEPNLSITEAPNPFLGETFQNEYDQTDKELSAIGSKTRTRAKVTFRGETSPIPEPRYDDSFSIEEQEDIDIEENFVATDELAATHNDVDDPLISQADLNENCQIGEESLKAIAASLEANQSWLLSQDDDKPSEILDKHSEEQETTIDDLDLTKANVDNAINSPLILSSSDSDDFCVNSKRVQKFTRSVRETCSEVPNSPCHSLPGRQPRAGVFCTNILDVMRVDSEETQTIMSLRTPSNETFEDALGVDGNDSYLTSWMESVADRIEGNHFSSPQQRRMRRRLGDQKNRHKPASSSRSWLWFLSENLDVAVDHISAVFGHPDQTESESEFEPLPLLSDIKRPSFSFSDGHATTEGEDTDDACEQDQGDNGNDNGDGNDVLTGTKNDQDELRDRCKHHGRNRSISARRRSDQSRRRRSKSVVAHKAPIREPMATRKGYRGRSRKRQEE